MLKKREHHKVACVDQICYMKSIRGKQQKAVKALERPKVNFQKHFQARKVNKWDMLH